MTEKKRLRVASESERLDLSTVLAAGEHGTALDELKAVRARLAREIDKPDVNPTALAALTRRLLEVSRDIRALQLKALEHAESEAVGDTDDERFDATPL